VPTAADRARGHSGPQRASRSTLGYWAAAGEVYRIGYLSFNQPSAPRTAIAGWAMVNRRPARATALAACSRPIPTR